MSEKRKRKGREMLTRNVRLTAEAHRLLSMLSAAMDTSISETVETVIREKYPQIAKAIEETDKQSAADSNEE